MNMVLRRFAPMEVIEQNCKGCGKAAKRTATGKVLGYLNPGWRKGRFETVCSVCTQIEREQGMRRRGEGWLSQR